MMTKEEIIEMAFKAGFVDYELDDGTTNAFDKRYEAFAKLVAEKEREACAEICDGFYLSWINIQGRYEFMGEGASECVDAIRARGQKGVANEFYPCKPDIFELTYEAVE